MSRKKGGKDDPLDPWLGLVKGSGPKNILLNGSNITFSGNVKRCFKGIYAVLKDNTASVNACASRKFNKANYRFIFNLYLELCEFVKRNFGRIPNRNPELHFSGFMFQVIFCVLRPAYCVLRTRL